MSTSADAMLDRLMERFDDEQSYSRRPVEWVRDVGGDFLWSAQREIAESVRDNRYTAVHSAHDMGKSAVAGRIGAWWIDSHPTGDAFLVSTAPTAAQVAAILWREVGKIHYKANLKGRITGAGYPQWKINGELVGYGRKPADHEDSAFQGIHALHVLVLIDEAGGVPKQLYNAIDALATNEYARVLAIGNPDDPGSHFAHICKPGNGWNTIHLDGLRSPNMSWAKVIGTDRDGYSKDNPKYPLTYALMRALDIPLSTEQVPPGLRPLLLDPLWIEERLKRWGGLSDTAHIDLAPAELADTVVRRAEASPLIQAKVRGIFPTATSTGVIPLGWVQYAVNRWHEWNDSGRRLDNIAEPSNRVVGVDVAYGGEDETVCSARVGNVTMELERFRNADTVETADFAAQFLMEPQSLAVVDVIGIGAGVYDTLRRYKREGRIQGKAMPFNAAAKSEGTDKIGEFRFRNDRAAAWWKMRELLDPSRNSKICLPDDERLIEELVSVQYEHLVGVIKIESKDDIRKRLGRSTDSADAVIQSYWTRGLPVPFNRHADAVRPRKKRETAIPYDVTRRYSGVDFDLGDPDALGRQQIGRSITRGNGSIVRD